MFRKLSVFMFLVVLGAILISAYQRYHRPSFEQFVRWTNLVITCEFDGVVHLSESELDEKDYAYYFVATRCPNLAKELRNPNRSRAKAMMTQMIDELEMGYFDQNKTFATQKTNEER